MSIFTLRHILLSIALILWCFLHSALISVTLVQALQKRLGSAFKFYRLFYNLVAALSLIPVYLLMRSMPAVPLFQWSGVWIIVQMALLAGGAFLLVAGSRVYDGMQFLGLRQIFSARHDIGLTESGGLHISGILEITRHPWYLAGLLVLWARDIDSVSLVVNIIFSLYLIIGAKIEEKKLVREFGEAYVEYQSRVSMLVPWKWLASRLQR